MGEDGNSEEDLPLQELASVQVSKSNVVNLSESGTLSCFPLLPLHTLMLGSMESS